MQPDIWSLIRASDRAGPSPRGWTGNPGTPIPSFARHRAQRESKPAPGTVAFPSAPLEHRSSIYITWNVGNPPAGQIKVKGTRVAGRWAGNHDRLPALHVVPSVTTDFSKPDANCHRPAPISPVGPIGRGLESFSGPSGPPGAPGNFYREPRDGPSAGPLDVGRRLPASKLRRPLRERNDPNGDSRANPAVCAGPAGPAGFPARAVALRPRRPGAVPAENRRSTRPAAPIAMVPVNHREMPNQNGPIGTSPGLRRGSDCRNASEAGQARAARP